MLIALLFAAATLAAGEGKEATALGKWVFGDGALDGRAAPIGTFVYTGQTVIASSRNPVRIELTGLRTARLILGAGGRMFLSVEPGTKPETRRLVVNLEYGAVQVDGEELRTFESVHVRGAAADVRMTGTLFVVERVQRDADFVALVKGKLKVGLRKSVAGVLNNHEEIELSPRQGVVVGANGFGAVTALNNRPVVPTTAVAAATSSVQDKTLGAPEGDGSWDKDLALDATLPGIMSPSDTSGDILKDQIVNAQNPGSNPGQDPSSGGNSDTASAAAVNDANLASTAAAVVFNELSNDIGKQVINELSLGGTILNDILDTLSLGELAGPPPPPAQ